MEEIGFDPAAVARTDDRARAARDEVDRATATDPPAARAAFRRLLTSPPSPQRQQALGELFRRACAAFNRRDWELNTLSLHPSRYLFEFGSGEGDTEGLIDLPTRLEGVEEYIEGMVTWQGAWAEVELTSEGVTDAGPASLFNSVRFRLRGPGSGLVLEQPAAVLFTFENGWVLHQRYWWDLEAGKRAAGVATRQRSAEPS